MSEKSNSISIIDSALSTAEQIFKQFTEVLTTAKHQMQNLEKEKIRAEEEKNKLLEHEKELEAEKTRLETEKTRLEAQLQEKTSNYMMTERSQVGYARV